MKESDTLYFTTKDSSNGTGSGKSASSAGNVFIQYFNVNDNQQWKFEYLYTDNSNPSTPEGAIDAVNSKRIKGWAWRSDKENEPINVKIKIVGANGVTYLNTNISANEYHNASYNSNYGNGYHGFSYNLYQLNLPSQTYSIYAYGIGDNNSLTQLANSPYVLNYNSEIEVSFERVPQIDERWCWAACAVMLGHNAYPNSVVTKEDVVQEIWGDLESSGGGFSAEVAAGAEFASQYNASFTVSEPLSFLEMRNLLNSGYLIHINIQYDYSAHAMIIFKCETVIEAGQIKEKVYLYDPDEDYDFPKYYSNLSNSNERYVNSVHIVI
jgi:hypothetical protein